MMASPEAINHKASSDYASKIKLKKIICTQLRAAKTDFVRLLEISVTRE